MAEENRDCHNLIATDQEGDKIQSLTSAGVAGVDDQTYHCPEMIARAPAGVALEDIRHICHNATPCRQ